MGAKKKRVRCLYRVSSKQQLHEDDIPLQRSECQGYIAKRDDWVFDGEYIEKGVSGFRNSLEQRGKLLEIREDARKKEFDVLLVYMSDRLGRREDETPFYIASLEDLGIEIWSVKEGQLKAQEHVEKLINYIRIWQAEGESRKTGIRVRDAHIDMIKNGRMVGGYTPYGYDRKSTGNITNHGRIEHDLFINEEQAKIVRQIFDYAVNYGYGAFKIAKTLNEAGIPNVNGGEWKSGTISDMLKNPIYMGYPAYGRRKKYPHIEKVAREDWILSEKPNPQYAIVSQRIWEKAQEIREARKKGLAQKKANNMGSYPTSTSGTLALLDIVYCGYCGKKLTNGSRYDYWTTKDGEKKRKIIGRYRCNSKAQGSLKCEGRAMYRQEELEPLVFNAVGDYLESLGKESVYDEILKMQDEQRKGKKKQVDQKRREMGVIERDLQTLKEQIPAAIRGETALSLERLDSLITEKEALLKEAEDILAGLEEEYKNTEIKIEDLQQYQDMAINWKKAFESAPVPVKRMMLEKLIERIDVKRDDISIKFKMRLEDFVPVNSEGSVVSEQGL